MHTNPSPRERGSALLPVLLVIIGALSIFGGARFLINQNQEKASAKEDVTAEKPDTDPESDGPACGIQSLVADQVQSARGSLDRNDYTSGAVGEAEFNAELARLDAMKVKADKALSKCQGEAEKDDSGSDDATTTTEAPATDPTATPDDPLVDDEGNTNPVLSEVRSYRSLVKALVAESGRGKWYTDDLQQFNGITRDDILRAVKLEEQGHDLRLILMSNTNLTDGEARAQLKAQGVKEVDRLPIVRVNGFINTRGLPNDRMNPFEDNRSQVRVSLGIPNDWNDLSKGLQADRGILTMCGNGWKLKKVSAPVAPPATPVKPKAPTPTQPPATVPPTSPPVTQPPVTQPPTTAPPVTTTRPPTTVPPKTPIEEAPPPPSP